MKLSDILDLNNIITAVKAGNKNGVIEELVEVMVENRSSLKKDELIKVLLERERLGSTGIGDGVAIPHGKFPGINEPIISFGRSEKGLDFDTMDGQPAHLFFLLVAPEDSASIHLKALARIAKILKNDSFRKQLMEASTREEIYQVITHDDEEF
jgi:PTS system nitrogen regulatory IIA component